MEEIAAQVYRAMRNEHHLIFIFAHPAVSFTISPGLAGDVFHLTGTALDNPLEWDSIAAYTDCFITRLAEAIRTNNRNMETDNKNKIH